ncbi:hypothetical protein ABZW44_42145 [Streptomyces mirabilis]|uniref:hypothetical protein n=1 Tax=Streptomyces mirabilis TaxID=68239 RepID=UPI0033B108F4
MSSDDVSVVEVGRAIRPYLSRLLDDPEEVARLDGALSQLLNGGQERMTADARLIHELLTAHEDTQWFMEQVLADIPLLRPPYHQRRSTPRQPDDRPSLGGDLGPVEADRFACPHGDYVDWYRPDVGTPVPRCPTHDVTLVRS